MVIRAAALTVLAVLTFAAPAAAQEPPSWLKFEGGATAAQFDFAQAIEEVVYVESEVDSDRDGARDLIRVRISRPGEAAERGYKVPVIFEHSPYRGDTGPAVNHAVDFDSLPQEQGTGAGALRQAETAAASALDARAGAGPRADLPGTLDNYFVPRGYAVVLGESIGTFNSQGCPDVGANAETLGTKAAIDWLNGRARGFDAAGAPVTADWSTGDVGMVGTSYNGTLPNQVATTGVEGLKTIIPVSAISSWYDYYRANGLVVAPHSETNGAGENGYLGEDTDVLGDFIGGPRMQPGGECRFMHDYLLARAGPRDRRLQPLLGRARLPRPRRRNPRERVRRPRPQRLQRQDQGVRGVVVPARQDRRRAQDLAAQRRPRRARRRRARQPYARARHRWFDHYLFGVANGIDGEPEATVQDEDGAYTEEADWPAPGAAAARLEVGARSRTAPGTLSAKRPAAVPQPFTDRGRELDTDDVLIQAARPGEPEPPRLPHGRAVA